VPRQPTADYTWTLLLLLLLLPRHHHHHHRNHHHNLQRRVVTSAKEVMFSSLSVCLSVCLLTGLLKTTDQIFMKFYGMLGQNPDQWIRFWL